MIGVGITVHNRKEMSNQCVQEWKRMMPKGSRLVIVDDGSEEPYKEATFRFESSVGVPKAKNKCLELLDDCDHIFLSDNDFWPISKDWYKKYIESEEKHLMYQFNMYPNGTMLTDSKLIFKDEKIRSFTHTRGVLLYIKKEVLDVVGGMDEAYGLGMHEHVDWSTRIYNAGLTSHKFMDVYSEGLFYCYDQLNIGAPSSIQNRKEQVKINDPYFRKNKNSKEKMNYKSVGNNVILTTYFTGITDIQTGKEWEDNLIDDVKVLKESTNNELVVISNLPSGDYYYESKITPYFNRWFAYYDYLSKNDVDLVWLLDATDTELLNNPWNIRRNTLYCGDEPTTLGCQWMKNMHRYEPLRTFINRNRNSILLNAGVLGGDRKTVMKFCNRMMQHYERHRPKMDMGAFNLIIKDFMYSHGRHVTTVFKNYEKTNAIWRHK